MPGYCGVPLPTTPVFLKAWKRPLGLLEWLRIQPANSAQYTNIQPLTILPSARSAPNREAQKASGRLWAALFLLAGESGGIPCRYILVPGLLSGRCTVTARLARAPLWSCAL